MLIDSRARLGWVVVTVGLLTAALFALADALGFGYGGFGRVQSLGLVWGLIIVASGGLVVYRGPSESDVGLVPAFGVAVVMMLVASALMVRVTSRPAYQATAMFTVRVADPSLGVTPPENERRLDLEEERMIFGVQVARLAVSLAADLNNGEFTWYGPERIEAPVPFDWQMMLNSSEIETDADSNQIIVHFRADAPTVARVGANLLVEAYLQVRPQIRTRPSCFPIFSTQPCPLEPIVVESVTFVPSSSRIDIPDGADVMLFLLASILVVYLTWKWWPTSGIPSDFVLVPAVVVALVAGVFWGYLWLVALAFVVGLLSVSGPIARYPADNLPIERETGLGRLPTPPSPGD